MFFSPFPDFSVLGVLYLFYLILFSGRESIWFPFSLSLCRSVSMHRFRLFSFENFCSLPLITAAVLIFLLQFSRQFNYLLQFWLLLCCRRVFQLLTSFPSPVLGPSSPPSRASPFPVGFDFIVRTSGQVFLADPFCGLLRVTFVFPLWPPIFFHSLALLPVRRFVKLEWGNVFFHIFLSFFSPPPPNWIPCPPKVACVLLWCYFTLAMPWFFPPPPSTADFLTHQGFYLTFPLPS